MNGIGRILFSSLLDTYSFKQVFGTLALTQLCLVSIIYWSVNYPWLYGFVVVLTMGVEGSIFAILPTITIDIFGHYRGHDLYSFIHSSVGL